MIFPNFFWKGETVRMFYQYAVRPLLFALSADDPEKAHEKALALLSWVGKHERLAGLIEQFSTVENERLEQEVFGLKFRNPVGLAAGFDKDGIALHGLQALGFGFLEMGTVTRYEQEGYPRPRIFRFSKDKAIINRMGFNNDGADNVAARMADTPRIKIPVGINIGKSKITPLEKASKDYCYSLQELYHYGDYFVVNVSSPNTPGLRELQGKYYLDDLLLAFERKNRMLADFFGSQLKPTLLKISPDLTWQEIDDILQVCFNLQIAGLIVGNTTVGRDGLSVITTKEGGLSGDPLWQKTISIVRYIHEHTKGRLPIIGVGGITNACRAYGMLKYACLIQVLTGLVYEGPFIVPTINRGLLRLMNRDGIRHISELRGR